MPPRLYFWVRHVHAYNYFAMLNSDSTIVSTIIKRMVLHIWPRMILLSNANKRLHVGQGGMTHHKWRYIRYLQIISNIDNKIISWYNIHSPPIVHVASENKCNFSTKSVVTNQFIKNRTYVNMPKKVASSIFSFKMVGRIDCIILLPMR